MKITFEEQVNSSIKKEVEKMLACNQKKSGNLIVEEIPDDELDCFAEDDDSHFIDNHKDMCDIYMIYQNIGGSWNQPISMVAVAD